MEDLGTGEIKISVTWRGKTMELTESTGCTVVELGTKLKELTNIAPNTMRLLVPKSKHSRASSLLPFSEQHGKLRLDETGIVKDQTIRMMGVLSAEVEEVSRSATKSEERIAGFLEEERRAKQLRANAPEFRKLPQGSYVFCDFRTLQLPGVELKPSAEKALAIMHKLASDPGIVAIMNKHRWRVGIMTEMAPVGYVGISPKCILGFNKNNGEEISLRLRTDDLKGFRKYESIKKTLLHELAHMVHSEHDTNFFALDKQLNEEVFALDWTKSSSRTLNGSRQIDETDEFLSFHEMHKPQKLGGNPLHSLVDAHVSAAAAALQRVGNSTVNVIDSSMIVKKVYSEPDPDDRELNDCMKPVSDQSIWEEPDPDDSQNGVNTVGPETIAEPDPDDSQEYEAMDEPEPDHHIKRETMVEPDPDDHMESVTRVEPDPDDHLESETMVEPSPDDCKKNKTVREPDPDDCGESKTLSEPDPDDCRESKTISEPDPDDCGESKTMSEPDPDDCGECKTMSEPDPDDCKESKTTREPDPDDCQECETRAEPATDNCQEIETMVEPDPDDCQENKTMAEQDPDYVKEVDMIASWKERSEPDPDDSVKSKLLENSVTELNHESDDSSPNVTFETAIESIQSNLENRSPDLRRIEESTFTACVRLQEAIHRLKIQVSPVEFASVIQTLFTILRNIMDHPNEAKFKRLRKANPIFERCILKYEAALEVLMTVGFSEDNISNELGALEAYLVLKRNDPGLLWLARSSLEVCSI